MKKGNRNVKKGTVILLIDGENIGVSRANEIEALARRQGRVVAVRVYHRQKDPSTQPWTEWVMEKSRSCRDIRNCESIRNLKNTGNYKDICLFGGPEQDKVDHKMQKDARRYMKSSEYDRVWVVTSDGGFECLAQEPTAKKKLCFIGEKKAPVKLRHTGVRFVELPPSHSQIAPSFSTDAASRFARGRPSQSSRV